MKFSEINLHPSVLEGLEASRFIEATPIQEKCIPHILEGKDLLGTAQTGTGKTGAFVVPLLSLIASDKEKSDTEKGTRVLILSPTRELASQIDEQIFALGYHSGVQSAIVIGGNDFSSQAKSMKSGVDIVVATPGRLLDQLKVLQLRFDDLEYLILDEADRMLDMGFLPDVKNIIKSIPKKRQTLLFSATFPSQIQKLAEDIMVDPVRVDVATSSAAKTIRQDVYKVYEADKLNLLEYLFQTELKDISTIVFTATKRGTDQLYRALSKRGLACEAMHGDRNQKEREDALRAFSTGKSSILIATDVIARGIDIQDVGLIVNFDCPKNVEDYIHRIGRTGRNEKEGRALTLVSPRDARLFKQIQDHVQNDLNILPLPENPNRQKEQKGSNNHRSSNRPNRHNQERSNNDSESQNRAPYSNKNENASRENLKEHRPLKTAPNNEKSKKSINTAKPSTVKVTEKAKYRIDRIQTASDLLKPGAKPTKGYLGILKAIFSN